MKQTLFINLLKKYTNIDIDFIDTFFTKFTIGGELDFHLKDIDVAKYLEIQLLTLRERLSNKYSKNKNYFEKVDFIKIKNSKTSSVTYMLNYQCFERLAMSGDSQKSETVRNYFIKLREFLTDNQQIILQSMTNKDELKKYVGFECLYFFAADERKNLLKVGITKDIISRLKTYNTGRINEIDLKYLAIVKNSKLIEKCIKLKLKTKQFYKNREIYEVEHTKLKKIIVDCYCKYVTKKENDTMYNELSQLADLYSYIKNKKHIKPYVIINK
jgi:phage anti-repressor protein